MPQTALRVLSVPALLVAALAAACSSPLLDDDPLLDASADPRFRTIEAVSFADESVSPPLTPEEAGEPGPEGILGPDREKATIMIALEDVRSSALANNLSLEVQRIEPDIARAITDAEEARFEAAFFARIDLEKEESDGPLLPRSRVNRRSLEPGIRIPLRTGGEARVSLPVEYRDLDVSGAGDVDGTDTGVRFSFSQPLLRGGGVEVNTAAIQVARFRDRQEEARTKLTAIRVLANAEKAYWELYATTREVEIQYDRYESAVEQLKQAKRLVEGGVVAEIEIVRAKTGVARRLDSVIESETLRRFAETNLKRIANHPDLPMEAATMLVPSTDPQPLGLELDPQRTAELAVANRMELLELEVQLAIDAVNVEVARNNELPVFALEFAYEFKGAGDSFSDSADSLDDGDLSDWAVGATIDIPIGNAAARARFRQAVLTRTRTLATKRLRELAIRQETHDALDQLERDWQRVLSGRQATILTGRNFEAERRQFQAGVRTSTEVLEAADFLAEARSREVNALADYQRSLVDLAFATGTVLGQSRIHWPAVAGEPSPRAASSTAPEPASDPR